MMAAQQKILDPTSLIPQSNNNNTDPNSSRLVNQVIGNIVT